MVFNNHMNKLIIIIIVAAAVGGGYWYWSNKNGGQEIYPTPTPPVTDDRGLRPENDTDLWKIYRNDRYGFEFKYPTNFILYKPDSTKIVAQNYFDRGGVNIISVAFPGGYYSGTNFNQGYLTVAFNGYIAQLNDCKTFPSELSKSLETLVINGVTLYGKAKSGVAAGTRYETEIYRGFKGDKCFEVNLNWSVGNIQNYSPGSTREVNEKEARQKLEAILSTFKIN